MENTQIEDRENLPPSVTPLDFDTVLVLRNIGNKRVIRFGDQSDDYGASFLEVDISYDPGEDAIALDIRRFETNVYERDVESHVRKRILLNFIEWKILREQIDIFHTEQKLKTLAEPERVLRARRDKEDDYPF
jgi:hypothetical protein